MAESKKFYSAKEAAVAVLAKAEQMLKSHALTKGGDPVAMPAGLCKAHKMEKCGSCGPMKKKEKANENEIGTKFVKGEAPPGEIHPKEHMEGEAMHPGARTETQPAPGNNPKEQSEGNNADWGTSPQVKGHIKLAHFMGHAGAKKQNQKNNNAGTAMGGPVAEGSAPAQPPVKKGHCSELSMAKDRNTRMDKVDEKQEMTADEAKAFRASLHVPQETKLTEQQKREQFRVFWAQAKRKYGQPKDLEDVVWLHLKSSKMDEPSQFEAGLAHFGLKKVN